MKVIKPGHVFEFELTFAKGFSTNPKEKPALKIRTTHPDYPELKVELVQPAAAARSAGA
jgi:hypothetical protein